MQEDEDLGKFLQLHREYLETLEQTNPEVYARFRRTTGVDMEFMSINIFLRQPSPSNYRKAMENFTSQDEMFKYIDDMNKVIMSAPRYDKPLVLYRGLTLDISKGDSVVFAGLPSTSLSLSTAAGFSTTDYDGGYVYKLEIPAGTPILYLGIISQVLEEQEMMLPLSCSFKRSAETTRGSAEDKLFNLVTCTYEGHLNECSQIDVSARLTVSRVDLDNRFIPYLMQLHNKHRTLQRYSKKTPEENRQDLLKETKDLIRTVSTQFGVDYRALLDIIVRTYPDRRSEFPDDQAASEGGKRKKTQKRRR